MIARKRLQIFGPAWNVIEQLAEHIATEAEPFPACEGDGVGYWIQGFAEVRGSLNVTLAEARAMLAAAQVLARNPGDE